ncbi:hypothetical protein TUM18999_24620 [Pseudomonas tohonis]|uniref:Uncharacterized protein n=1 Tax=Pseudomonas tohonis TaxID=2725477 RepID=A0A6J4E6Y8_9PSED|nr:hypothetical protein [Pseudomonas tohonis]BCG24271.1 hypothetical protein TUM18999_24620 [Pseudomonas tohonis]GJN52375.1 hypothetical protein TUM20286_21270 [Pseudomonas tohonis]
MTLKQLLAACLAVLLTGHAAAAQTVDPNSVRLNDRVHEQLSPQVLARIRAVTQVFEPIDGISYERAVDLYKRDAEANLVIFEEMARVYREFCASRCSRPEERMDVYRLVLLRSMYSFAETLRQAQLDVLSKAEAQAIVDAYRLKAIPITVEKR